MNESNILFFSLALDIQTLLLMYSTHMKGKGSHRTDECYGSAEISFCFLSAVSFCLSSKDGDCSWVCVCEEREV